MSLLNSLFGWKRVDDIFTASLCIQRMLDFEAALAFAETESNVIPMNAANAIAAQCRAERFDLNALAHDALNAGNLAIPLIKQLTSLVEATDRDAARYVHWGATSQDVIDTGLILQLRDAFDAIEMELHRLCKSTADLAGKHRATAMPARTWLQQAVPTVFGLKAAGWLDALLRHRARLHELRDRVLVIQFGGAAGTLASLGHDGIVVAERLAKKLELGLPSLPWHSHRDRIAEVGTSLALLTGTLGKMVRDISLMMQTEVAEAVEPAAEGRGGSSTMPHKRNPVACTAILAAATQVPALACTLLTAMPQEHERGVGGWHAEWETLPELVRRSAGALHRMANLVEGLEIDSARMRDNLELTRGLIFAEAVAFALGRHIGKPAAHKLVEAASRKATANKKHLRQVLSEDPEFTSHCSTADLEKFFEPQNYFGVADEFINRTIAASKKLTEEQR
jgi:3-carboxy-cis,cis-muconate cycloisomerase